MILLAVSTALPHTCIGTYQQHCHHIDTHDDAHGQEQLVVIIDELPHRCLTLDHIVDLGALLQVKLIVFWVVGDKEVVELGEVHLAHGEEGWGSSVVAECVL